MVPEAQSEAAGRAWQYNGPLQAVSKAEVLREMAQPIDELCPARTAEETKRALAFLVEQGMVEVEGEQHGDHAADGQRQTARDARHRHVDDGRRRRLIFQ